MFGLELDCAHKFPLGGMCAGRYFGGGLESALARDGQISQQVGVMGESCTALMGQCALRLETSKVGQKA